MALKSALCKEYLATAKADDAAGREHEWGSSPMPNMWGQWDVWEGPFYFNADAIDKSGNKGCYVAGKAAIRPQ